MKQKKEKPPTFEEMLEMAKQQEAENERIYQEQLKEKNHNK